MSNKELQQLSDQALNAFNNRNLQLAMELANKVIQQDPTHLTALEIMSMIMVQANNMESAIKITELITKQYPDNCNAFANLANLYFANNKTDEAITAIKKAITINKNDVNFFRTLGNFLLTKGNLKEALENYDKSHTLAPELIPQLETLCDITYGRDKMLFPKYLEKLYQVTNHPILKICYETQILPFYPTQEEIDKAREILNNNLDKLINDDFLINDVKSKVYLSIFYLANHNRNNKLLREKFALLFRKKFPQINYIAPHCGKKRDSDKIKVGFISNNFYEKHPVAKCFNKIIHGLTQKDDLEVHIFFINEGMDKHKNDNDIKMLVESSHKFISLNQNIEDIKKAISEEKLDYLIYTDIGMYWLTYFLSFCRLAPIQCMMTGHPETSGVDTVDYYLSSKNMEGGNAKDYYSEKLILFNTIITFHNYPNLPENLKSRKELNLPEGKNIYYCPMKAQKFHPDFDQVFVEILKRDNNSVILIPDDEAEITKLLKERIERGFGASLGNRLTFHPWVDNEKFYSYLKNSDIVLDSYPFGAGTTTYFSFAVDTPIITMPTETAINRVTLACYKQMEIPCNNLVATDFEDYITKAIKIANDKEDNQKVRNFIRNNKMKLFANPKIIDEYADFLRGNLN